MKNTLVTLLFYSFFCGLGMLHAQNLTDDFSDGDFTNNPIWVGTTTQFRVNASNELQLHSTGTDTAYLSTAANLQGTATWEFSVRMAFSPSSNNYARIYLQANHSDLKGAINGYYIQIGERGATDALKLYRQDGVSSSLIMTGTSAGVASSPDISVRVSRDNTGSWTMEVDYTGGTNYAIDATGTDSTYAVGNFIGIFCRYTSSNASKFYFDDILAGPLFIDTIPPTIASAIAVITTEVDVDFNEPLDLTSAQLTSNYTVDNGVAVLAAVVDSSDPSLVHLTVSPLSNGTTYQLTVNGVEDASSNPTVNERANFTYYLIQVARAGDIVINEIFADPNPTVGLPSTEFVELYNKANYAIDLTGYTFYEGSSRALPSYVILPRTYVILCASSSVVDYQSYGQVLDIGGMSLTNGGENIYLADASGQLIDSLSYDEAWYRDADKEEGGWSLELINPNQTCLGASNWTASTDSGGGTPGRQNSVYDNTADTLLPTILELRQVSANQVRLNFSEVMDTTMLATVGNYTIDNGLFFVNATVQGNNAVLLTANNDFTNYTVYTIDVNGARDCVGNAQHLSIDFTFYEIEVAAHYDILINEIFPDYNPQIGLPELEYIELYNRSNKVVNLERYTISDGSSAVGTLPFFILEPNSYVLIHKDDGTSPYAVYGDFLALGTFPDLNTSGDDLVLRNAEGRVVDAVSYDPSWFQNEDKEEGGWSLERINPNRPCEGSSNWRASENNLGGTPARANSILQTEADTDAPDLIRAYPFASKQVRLFFSEAMGDTSATNTNYYILDNNKTVTEVVLEPPFYNTVVLTLDTDLEVEAIYTLELITRVTDCEGNAVGVNRTVQFALPKPIVAGDVILNEILFNPVVGGSDFVELYNNSSKVVNVGDLIFANTKDKDLVHQTDKVATDWLLFPGQYVVISGDIDQVRKNYQTENPNHFIENDLPTYGDDEGSVIIYNVIDSITGTDTIPSAQLVDQFDYLDDYHTALLDDENGVSLERIDFDAPTQDRNNWHTAATDVGYATPAYQNSSYRVNEIAQEGIIQIPDNVFSPDGDSYEDFLLINYNVDAIGYVANVKIYDTHGRLIRSLVNGVLLAYEGTFQWDGADDAGNRAKVGIYIIVLEIYNPAGDVQRMKRTCVVAGTF